MGQKSSKHPKKNIVSGWGKNKKLLMLDLRFPKILLQQNSSRLLLKKYTVFSSSYFKMQVLL